MNKKILEKYLLDIRNKQMPPMISVIGQQFGELVVLEQKCMINGLKCYTVLLHI